MNVQKMRLFSNLHYWRRLIFFIFIFTVFERQALNFIRAHVSITVLFLLSNVLNESNQPPIKARKLTPYFVYTVVFFL